MDDPPAPDVGGAGNATVELRLRDTAPFFDALDASPYGERDLDPRTEEYILDSVKEFPTRTAHAIVVHVDHESRRPDEDALLVRAIQGHFARRAEVLRRNRRELIRSGLISLAIAAVFLAAVFALGRLVRLLLGERGWPDLLREGLLIVGWVAMWKPLEIFLYGWWPILGDERLCRRLSGVEVRVVRTGR